MASAVAGPESGYAWEFELGAFDPGCTPFHTSAGSNNMGRRAANWNPFDRTIYMCDENDGGRFRSRVYMDPAHGTSRNGIAGGMDFSDLSAYLWVRNTVGTDAAFSTAGQFLLARDAGWTFPELGLAWDLPVEWSATSTSHRARRFEPPCQKRSLRQRHPQPDAAPRGVGGC
jgi:hypothetical protein